MNVGGKQISQQHLQLIVLCVGLLGAFSAWNGVRAKVQSWSYQPVYGANAESSAPAAKPELAALPIVIAKSEEQESKSAAPDEDMVSAAFEAPKPEPVEEVEDKPAPLGLAQQVQMRFRPVVSGVTHRGAIINGNFWAIGERIPMLALHNGQEVTTPFITAITNKAVTLQIGAEQLSLPYQAY